MRYRRTMRTLRTITTALIMAAALAACSSDADPAVQGYYDTLHDIEMFEDTPTDDLDKMAVQACELIEKAVANGWTNMEAADLVYQSFVNVGTSEAEALMASTALVSAHCPIDISE